METTAPPSGLPRVVHGLLCLVLLSTFASVAVGNGALTLAAVLGLIHLGRDCSARERALARLRALPFLGWWGLLWGWTALSWAVTWVEGRLAGVPVGFREVHSIKADLFFLLAVLFFEYRPAALRRFGVWAVAVAVLAALATLAMGTWTDEPRLLPTLTVAGRTVTLGGVNGLGAVSVVVLLFAASEAIAGDLTRTGLAVTLMASVPVLLATARGGCRSALVGLVLGLWYLVGRARPRLALAAGVLLLGGGLVASTWVAPRFAQVSLGVEARREITADALASIRRAPLVGFGLLDRDHIVGSGLSKGYDAHNSILNMAVRRGVPAAALSMVVQAGSLVLLWRMARAAAPGSAMRPWVDGAVAATAVVLVFALTLGAWFATTVRFVQFWLMAFAAGHPHAALEGGPP